MFESFKKLSIKGECFDRQLYALFYGYKQALANSDKNRKALIEKDKDCKTTNTVYSLSPEFRGQMSLLQEATRIGLTHILKGQDNNIIINDAPNDGTSDETD